jgi:hypothetical protein
VAHELKFEPGKASMFYYGQALGTASEQGYRNHRQQRRRIGSANLDWEVAKFPKNRGPTRLPGVRWSSALGIHHFRTGKPSTYSIQLCCRSRGCVRR